MKFTLLLIIAIIDFSYSVNVPRPDEILLWKNLNEKMGFTEQCTASFMGNLYAESGLKSASYDIAYHQELGLTDSEYVRQVNKGQYSEQQFINDNIGFGLARWRDSTRKQGLYQLCHRQIGNLACQISYIEEEIRSNPDTHLYDVLKSGDNIDQCHHALIVNFFNTLITYDENNRRIKFAEAYYETYAKKK